MAKKKLPELCEDLDSLNDSELRVYCELVTDRNLSPFTPREELLEFVRNGKAIGPNPVDDIRMHQTVTILDKYSSFRSQIPRKLQNGGHCEGCCFDHDDMQVLECQLNSAPLKYPKLSLQTGE